MESSPFTSPLVQVLWNELYPQVDKAAAEAGGFPAMMWKSFKPQIPEYLGMLDKDKEAQKKILGLLKKFLATVEETDNDPLPDGGPGQGQEMLK